MFAVEKIDFMAAGPSMRYLPALLEFARAERTALSLRVGDPGLIDGFAAMDSTGLHDVFLTQSGMAEGILESWSCLCEERGLPVRVQVSPPEAGRQDPDRLADLLQKAVAVIVSPAPSFCTARPRSFGEKGHEAIRWMNDLACALRQRGVETHLTGLPFCHVDEGNYSCVVNVPQFFLHHQHYLKQAYEFAETIFSCSPNRMAMLVENRLNQGRSMSNAVDNALLPWILGHPKAYARTWMLHKIRRHLPRFRKPAPIPEGPMDWETALEGLRKEKEKGLGRECACCRFHRICDRATPAFKELFPKQKIESRPGTVIVDPLCFMKKQDVHYDGIDEARRHLPRYLELLAEHAHGITTTRTPTREIPVDAYEIENHYNPIDDASKRWISLSKGELLSTILGRLQLPFTMMLTFGGGIAEQIGFSFGRGARIVCPMIDYSHRSFFT